MSTELTEAERAAWELMQKALSPNTPMLARRIVAAVRPIIEAEITQHPDVDNLDRGFGNCPHCLSPGVTRCHECGTETFRDHAAGFGWRMDHISGFGCLALCRNCRDDGFQIASGEPCGDVRYSASDIHWKKEDS
jgi:hypothetical protein